MRIEPTPFKGGEDPLPLYREDQSAADFPIHFGELRSVVEVQLKLFKLHHGSTVCVSRYSLLQTNVDVELLHSSTSPTSLFFLTMQNLWERKLPDKLLTAGIHKHEVEKERAYRSDMERYDDDLSEYNKLKKKAKSFESILQNRLNRYILCAWDPTIRASKSPYKKHPSVLILSDEAGVTLSDILLTKTRIKTAAGLSKVWDGSRQIELEVDGTQTLRGDDPHCTNGKRSG